MDGLNLDQFAKPVDDNRLAQLQTKQPPRHKTGEWFVKGPIPGSWLEQAAKLPGKSLHVAMVLWTLAGINGCRQIRLERKVLGRFNVERWAARKGLARLQAAGLVQVDRKPGRSPIVKLLDYKPNKPRKETLPNRSEFAYDKRNASAVTRGVSDRNL